MDDIAVSRQLSDMPTNGQLGFDGETPEIRCWQVVSSNEILPAAIAICWANEGLVVRPT
jgi:hypothetical protein